MRGAKRLFLSQEEEHKLRVGILGSGPLIQKLEEKLIAKNCTVIISSKLSPSFAQCQYIFQLDTYQDFENVASISRKNRAKLLLVVSSSSPKARPSLERFFGEQLQKHLKGKLLLIGDIRLWDDKKLVETMLWAMFSSGLRWKMDFSKEGFGESPPRPINRKRDLEFRYPKWSKYFLFLLILLLPLITLLFNFLFLSLHLYDFEKRIYANDWEKAQESLQRAKNDAAINSAFLQAFYFGLGPFGESVLVGWSDIYTVSVKSIDVGESLLKAREIITSQKMGILSPQSKLSLATIKQLDSLVSKTHGDIKEIRKALMKISVPFFPKERFLSRVDSISEQLEIVQNIMPFLVGIAESNNSYRFLILFQNNMELRPTGGFIGSYGLGIIKEGSVSFKIYDVYDADGKLKAHVDPPFAIRTYLSQPNWFLRDSNFDPDFSISAQQAEWFLEKETGEVVDGVIGINLSLVKNILKVLGPIYIPDYKEYITADNLFIKSTVYIQKGFFPGSTAKKDFLSSLSNAMFFMLSNGEKMNWVKLIPVVSSSIDAKDILLYFNDENLQKRVEEKGWGGRMVDISCRFPSCSSDYISLIDANLGVNKANLYIERDVDIVKKIEEDGVTFTDITISYQNSSPNDVFPSGAYKNYLRFYIPYNSTILELSIDGGLSDIVERKKYGLDKEEVGVWVEVLPQSKKIVHIRYSGEVVSSDKSAYQLFYQKQPGEETADLSLQFSFPNSWDVQAKNFQSLKRDGSFFYTTDSSSDRVFIFDMKKD